MGRNEWLPGIMALTILGCSWTAFGDSQKSAPGDAPGISEDEAESSEGMQGGMMGDHLARLKEKLGLTENQVVKLKGLFKKQLDNLKPLRDQMKIDMDTLQQKVDTQASEGEIKKCLDNLKADRKSMEKSRQKMEDQLRDTLSPTQQAKFVLDMEKRSKQMMRKWKGQWHRDGKKGESSPGAQILDNQQSKDGGGEKDN